MAEDLEGRGKVSAVLRWGSALAASLMAAGLIFEKGPPGPGQALMRLGILALVAVPVLRVALLAGIFARLGERRMVAVSLGVLALMSLGIWLGL